MENPEDKLDEKELKKFVNYAVAIANNPELRKQFISAVERPKQEQIETIKELLIDMQAPIDVLIQAVADSIYEQGDVEGWNWFYEISKTKGFDPDWNSGEDNE
jgi:hypothetical protein